MTHLRYPVAQMHTMTSYGDTCISCNVDSVGHIGYPDDAHHRYHHDHHQIQCLHLRSRGLHHQTEDQISGLGQMRCWYYGDPQVVHLGEQELWHTELDRNQEVPRHVILTRVIKKEIMVESMGPEYSYSGHDTKQINVTPGRRHSPHLVVEQDAHGAPRALSTTMRSMATSSMARLFTSGNRPLEQMSQIRTRRHHDHLHDQGEHHDLSLRSQVRRPDRRV